MKNHKMKINAKLINYNIRLISLNLMVMSIAKAVFFIIDLE